MESIVGLADQKAFYEATKPIFCTTEMEDQFKKDKLSAVRNAIKHSNSPSNPPLQDLVYVYGIDTLFHLALGMLSEGLYRYPRKAEQLFAHVRGKRSQGFDYERNMGIRQAPQQAESSSASPPFPVYLHFKAQHNLMTNLQRILEYACFTFWEKTMPQFLIANGWTCPESVELSEWISIFKREKKIYATAGGRPLSGLLHAMASIRNMAVHRVTVTSRGLEQCLADGAEFIKVLGSIARFEGFYPVQEQLEPLVEELIRTKNFLRQTLEHNLAFIAQQRAMLDRMEEDILANRSSGYKAYRDMAREERQKATEHMESPTAFEDAMVAKTEPEATERMYDTATMSEEDGDELDGSEEEFEDCEMDEEFEGFEDVEEFEGFEDAEEFEVLEDVEELEGTVKVEEEEFPDR